MKTLWTGLVLSAVIALTGCSSSGSPSPSVSPASTARPAPASSTVTVTRSATATSTQTSTATVAPSHVSAPTTTATNSVTRCPASSLTMSRPTGDGAGGTQYLTVRLTNSSRSTCTLYGYPGVSVIDSAGHTVQHPARRGRTGTLTSPRPKTVTLAPGRPGYFLLTSVNVIPNGDCKQAFHGRRLRVYPPDSTRALTVAFTLPFCDLGVGPVTATAN